MINWQIKDYHLFKRGKTSAPWHLLTLSGIKKGKACLLICSHFPKEEKKMFEHETDDGGFILSIGGV